MRYRKTASEKVFDIILGLFVIFFLVIAPFIYIAVGLKTALIVVFLAFGVLVLRLVV